MEQHDANCWPRWTSNDCVIAMAIGILALVLRLVFLYSSPDRAWPHSAMYEGDAPVWAEWAAALERGQVFEYELPLRAPGVAYLLSWMGSDGAPPFTIYKVIWCVMSALTCAIAYLAFRKGFSKPIALIAAFFCTFSFGSYVTATSLNNECPYQLALFASIYATFSIVDRPRLWLAISLALLHGCALLLRAEHLLALVLMIGYMLLRWHSRARDAGVHASQPVRFGRAMMMAAIIGLGAIIVCLPWSIAGARAIDRFNTTSQQLPEYEYALPPWTPEARMFLDALPAFARQGNFMFITDRARAARQQQVTREFAEAFFRERFGSVPQPLSRFVLVSMKGPLDFALANHPLSDGGFTKHALAVPGETDPTLYLGRPDHTRLINEGNAIGFEYIRSDFPGWLRLVLKKLDIFADGIAGGFTARNLPVGIEGVRRPVDLMTARPNAMHLVWQWMVLALTAAGIAISLTRKTGGIWLTIIAYKLIVTILFYGYARQAVSILPAFYIFAVVVLDYCIARLENMARRVASQTR